MVFQCFDLVTDSRGRDKELFGRQCKAFIASSGFKNLDGIEWGKVSDDVYE